MKKSISVSEERCPVMLIPKVVYSQRLDAFGMPQKPLEMHFLRPNKWRTAKEIAEGISTYEKLPTILWFTGGGFWRTVPLRYAAEYNYLVDRGFQVVMADYRVSGEATFPAAVQDAKTAVRFLKSHAEQYGVDPERIAVMGESAGGYLAAMVGVSSESAIFDTDEWNDYDSSVKAVVDLYGPVDLSNMTEKPVKMMSPIVRFLGEKGMSDEHIKWNANVINHIFEHTPPFLILHGTDDTVVPIEQSDILYEALQKNGIQADFYALNGERHAGNIFWQNPVKEIIAEFLVRHL